MREVSITVGTVVLTAELYDTPTADTIYGALPFEAQAQTWGEEVYFPTSVEALQETDAKTVIDPGEIAFWLAGNCIAIGYGPTPVSRGKEIRLASPGNVWARTSDDVKKLAAVKDGDKVRVERVS